MRNGYPSSDDKFVGRMRNGYPSSDDKFVGRMRNGYPSSDDKFVGRGIRSRLETFQVSKTWKV